MNLAKLLEAYLSKEGISTRRFAVHIGCHHTTLWRFIQGKPIDGATLIALLTWAFKMGDKSKVAKFLDDAETEIASR